MDEKELSSCLLHDLLKSDFPMDRLSVLKDPSYSGQIGPLLHFFFYYCVYRDRKVHI